jgi:Holliday junction resolvase-like predicted endonuclease
MKRHLFILFIGAALLSASCYEIPPVINPYDGEPVDTTINIEDQERQVLIEEFTGVRCVQCPAGSAEIETLLAIHGERLVAVSIHAGDFAPPFSQSLYDFRTTEGEGLINLLGPPISYPSAVVNRRLFEGENDLILGRNDWAGFIEVEKAVQPKVKIGLKATFNETSRNLDLEVKIYPQEIISDPDVRISVMLTESNIVDYQEIPVQGKIPDYVHKHVLRDMLTSYLGDVISETLAPGTIVTKNYSFTVPGDWKEAGMKAVAFVHLEGTVKDVLQAAETSVVK